MDWNGLIARSKTNSNTLLRMKKGSLLPQKLYISLRLPNWCSDKLLYCIQICHIWNYFTVTDPYIWFNVHLRKNKPKGAWMYLWCFISYAPDILFCRSYVLVPTGHHYSAHCTAAPYCQQLECPNSSLPFWLYYIWAQLIV